MVKVNQVVELEITGYTHDGLGIGRVEGFPVFVRNAVRGQILKAVITKPKKNLAFAKIESILKHSKEERVYECDVYDQCGGCNIGHLSDGEQAYLKKDKVENAYRKIARSQVDVKECITMSYPFRYRNKVAVPVKTINGELKAGFYKNRSHDLIQFSDCLVQTKRSNEIIKQTLLLMKEFGISAYNEQTLKGQVRHIIIREAFIAGEIMVCLVINEAIASIEDFASKFKLATNVDTLVTSINQKKTSVILGDKFETIYGKGFIVDYINDVRFKISANSFYQINQSQTEKLYSKAIEIANFDGSETVLDAYCGIGSIGLNFAKKVKRVVGIEVVEQAIIDAKENAKLNNIENCEFYAGDVSDVIKQLDIKFDAVVVDPPRKGCSSEFLDVLANEMKVKKIVYISCDVSTQARDVQYLKEFGYETKEVFPVDLFPHTHHIETICLLVKK